MTVYKSPNCGYSVYAVLINQDPLLPCVCVSYLGECIHCSSGAGVLIQTMGIYLWRDASYFFPWALSKHMPLVSLFQTLNPPFPDEQEILPEHLLKCSLFCALPFVCPTRTEEHSWWLKTLCVSYTHWGSESTVLKTWARQLNWRDRI